MLSWDTMVFLGLKVKGEFEDLMAEQVVRIH